MKHIAIEKQGQLSLRKFCKTYRVGHSTAKREIARGHIKTKRDGAQEVIDWEEAERWLANNCDRARVTHALNPEKNAVIYGGELLCLLGCSNGYAGGAMPDLAARRVARLRRQGINIETVERSGQAPEFRLHDLSCCRFRGRRVKLLPPSFRTPPG